MMSIASSLASEDAPVAVPLTVPESDKALPEIDNPPLKKGGKKGTPKSTGKKQKKSPTEEGEGNLSKSKLRKLLRNTGQEYVTKKGKVIKSKLFDNKDCGCSRKCKSKIAVEDRQKCFDKFWKMGDFGKQNAYLSGLVTREAVKQHRPRLNCTNRGPKGVTYQYRVNVGRVSKQVCKKYFLQSFLVSDGRLSRALRKEENEKEPSEDLRGKKPPANKTSEEQINRVKDHIASFPKYDAHYTLSPKGKYLKSDLNVKKMYGMYVEHCGFADVPFVKENIYRSVFNEHYSLSFLSPRRDACHTPRDPSKVATPRKKVCKTSLAGVPERASVQAIPAHQKIQVAPQVIYPSENVKCIYSGPHNMNITGQEKIVYPGFDNMIQNNYFTTQDQGTTLHHTYPAQTPSFFNL